MAVNSEAASIRGQVVSDTPGRLRVRIHPSERHAAVIRGLKEHLENKPGIRAVAENTGTGSLLVQYDHDRLSTGDVLEMLYDAGLILYDILKDETYELPAAGHSETAVHVINAVNKLDRDLARVAGRKVDLKVLVPFTVGGIGLLKIMRDGLDFAEIPGYILIWYAFDMFYKFHTARGSSDVPPAAQGAAAGAPAPVG